MPQRRTSTLPVSSLPTGTLSCGRLGTDISRADMSAWDDFQTVCAGLEFVTNASNLSHDRFDFRRGVFTLGSLAFEHADLLGQTVALGLQVFRAGLDGLALGFQFAETGLVQERLGVLRLARRARTLSRSLRSRAMSSMLSTDLKN